MKSKGLLQSKYEQNRRAMNEPMISIRILRTATGITIDELRERIFDACGHDYSRGTISAVENGHRGASQKLIEQMEIAYGLPEGSIQTSYRPRKASIDDMEQRAGNEVA